MRRRFAAKHKHQSTLQPHASDFSIGNYGFRTELVIGEHIVCAKQTQGKVPFYIQIDTATHHESETIIAPEKIGRKPVPAQQSFKKRREVAAAEGHFRSQGNVVKGGIVNSFRRADLAAA